MSAAEVIRHALALRAVRPFELLTERELLVVAARARMRDFGPQAVLLGEGSIAETLFVTVGGSVEAQGRAAPRVFDAASLLFGRAVRADHVAGPEGAVALCLAKPHLFTIARECPDFVVGLTELEPGGSE